MAALLILLMASFAVSLGGRAQITLVALCARPGSAKGVLAAAVLSALAGAVVMGLAGTEIASAADSVWARVLGAAALVLAAGELAWPVRISAPKEPTHSLGAIGLVLLARQLCAAPGLIILAGALLLDRAAYATAGGAAGSALAMWLGWLCGGRFAEARSLRFARRVMAALSFLIAMWIASGHALGGA